MKNVGRTIAILGFAAIATLGAQAQFYKIHNGDIAVGGTGQFTTTITDNGKASQSTTDSAGFLFTFKEHPVSWAGVEINYGYTDFSERFHYANPNGTAGYVNVPADMHEATAAYVIHPHFKHFQPFLNLGGGAIDFEPNKGRGYHQWRGTGLLEVGMDIPTGNPHLGLRVQGRSLAYRAPNFGTPIISSQRWVATNEPSVSVYYRF